MRKLYTHQVNMFKYACKVRHPALFVEMRLGKTLVCIRRILAYKDCKYILIVAPSSALFAWERELELECQYSVSMIGSREEKLGNFEHIKNLGGQEESLGIKNKIFCLINKEGFLSLPEIAQFDWDVVILDESTFIKNPKAKVTKFFLSNFREVKHRWLLTGLPNPESSLNYFCQFKFLSQGILREKNYWDFRIKHYKNISFHKWSLTTSGSRYLDDAVKDNAFSLTRKQAGLFINKVYEDRIIDLPKDIRRTYNKVISEFILEYKSCFKATKFAMVKYHWLRQLCGGFIDKKLVWNGKVNELLELLQGELLNEQVVVWYSYTAEIEYSKEILHENNISCEFINGSISFEERSSRIKSFRSGAVRVLLCEIHCGLFGIDLSNADTAIYYSNPLGYQDRSQSEDRVLSLTKKVPLLFINLIVKNTVDELLIKSLFQKENYSKILKRVFHEIN